MAVNIEELIAQLKQLPDEQKTLILKAMERELQKPSLDELRAQSEDFWNPVSVQQLIAQQNGQPLGTSPEFDLTMWPEDESLDDFLGWLKSQRQASAS